MRFDHPVRTAPFPDGDFQRFVIFGGFISETVRDVSPSAARRAAHFKLELSVKTWRAPYYMTPRISAKKANTKNDRKTIFWFLGVVYGEKSGEKGGNIWEKRWEVFLALLISKCSLMFHHF